MNVTISYRFALRTIIAHANVRWTDVLLYETKVVEYVPGRICFISCFCRHYTSSGLFGEATVLPRSVLRLSCWKNVHMAAVVVLIDVMEVLVRWTMHNPQLHIVSSHCTSSVPDTVLDGVVYFGLYRFALQFSNFLCADVAFQILSGSENKLVCRDELWGGISMIKTFSKVLWKAEFHKLVEGSVRTKRRLLVIHSTSLIAVL